MDFLKFDAVKCTLCGKCIDKCPFGALRILTQVTLKLLPAPTCSRTLVMPFNSLEECADMVPEVLALPFVPTAIEFLERELIDIVERNLGKLPPVKQGGAVLIVMYDALSRQELDSAVEAAAEAALAHGAIDCCIAKHPGACGVRLGGARRHPCRAMRPLRRWQHPYRDAARSRYERRGVEARHPREPDRAVRAVQGAGRPAFRRARQQYKNRGRRPRFL